VWCVGGPGGGGGGHLFFPGCDNGGAGNGVDVLLMPMFWMAKKRGLKRSVGERAKHLNVLLDEKRRRWVNVNPGKGYQARISDEK